MVEKACIDPHVHHMLPDTVISLEELFMKLPSYNYFMQNEIDADIFLSERSFR